MELAPFLLGDEGVRKYIYYINIYMWLYSMPGTSGSPLHFNLLNPPNSPRRYMLLLS